MIVDERIQVEELSLGKFELPKWMTDVVDIIKPVAEGAQQIATSVQQISQGSRPQQFAPPPPLPPPAPSAPPSFWASPAGISIMVGGGVILVGGLFMILASRK